MVDKDEQFWGNVRNLLVWRLSGNVPGRAIPLQTDICMIGTVVKNMGIGKFHFKQNYTTKGFLL